MEVLRMVLVHDIARALLVAAMAFVLTLFVGRWWVHLKGEPGMMRFHSR